MTTKLSPKTRRAIAAYGQDVCVAAFRKHHEDGEGASTVGFCLGLKTRQADAAIDAGRELDAACALRIRFVAVGEEAWRSATVPGLAMLAAYAAAGTGAYAPSRVQVRNAAAVAHAKTLLGGGAVACLQVL